MFRKLIHVEAERYGKIGNRRRFLTAFGATSLAALAGCIGDGDGGDDNGDDNGDTNGDTNGDDNGDTNGDDNGDDNGDTNGDDNGEEELEIDELTLAEETIDGLYDPGQFNQTLASGGVSPPDDSDTYDGRIVDVETDGDVVYLEAITPEELPVSSDAIFLAEVLEMGFLSDDPDDIREFSYDRLEVEVQTVEGEDLGNGFVEVDWVIEFYETDNYGEFIDTVVNENIQG